uniref:Glycosyltransferase 25 family member n=1 Tax=Plectus sambesii TaxID=2011161 RepID=A0A914W2S2_9BILA
MTVVVGIVLRPVWIIFVLSCAAAFNPFSPFGYDEGDYRHLYPRVQITFFARNKAHTLPYFLGQLEELEYPKDRISLYVRTDHNSDDTVKVLDAWVEGVRTLYNSIDYRSEPTESSYADEEGPLSWSAMRNAEIITLKEEALAKARAGWADYVFLLDCDYFLIYRRTLQSLMLEKQAVVSPMLRSYGTNFSNVCESLDEEGYCLQSDVYSTIVSREVRTGSFQVPMVSGAVLIDLRHTDSGYLTFDKNNLPSHDGAANDLLIFAASAHNMQIPLFVDNKRFYGYMLEPTDASLTLQDDEETMRDLLLNLIADEGLMPLLYSPHAQPRSPKPSRFGFDQIYLINLARRPERLAKMRQAFALLGIEYQLWPAVDGRNLSEDVLMARGVRMMPNYEDPYFKRPLKLGEIGCFLSHYDIWRDAKQNGYERVIVFEDDLRFHKYAAMQLEAMVADMDATELDWDLIYLGRKREGNQPNGAVPGQRFITTVGYSYWTLGYALSARGVNKLLAAKPLEKMVAVDEFLPIMFNKHPRQDWNAHFERRDLKAFTAEPLIVEPERFANQQKYVTDTEDSAVVSVNSVVAAGSVSHEEAAPSASMLNTLSSQSALRTEL